MQGRLHRSPTQVGEMNENAAKQEWNKPASSLGVDEPFRADASNGREKKLEKTLQTSRYKPPSKRFPNNIGVSEDSGEIRTVAWCRCAMESYLEPKTRILGELQAGCGISALRISAKELQRLKNSRVSDGTYRLHGQGQVCLSTTLTLSFNGLLPPRKI